MQHSTHIAQPRLEQPHPAVNRFETYALALINFTWVHGLQAKPHRIQN